MSSQVFLGPTPIREKICNPPFKLATALLETAAGIEGTFGSAAPNNNMAHETSNAASANNEDHFFIVEILRLCAQDGKDHQATRLCILQAGSTPRSYSMKPCRTA